MEYRVHVYAVVRTAVKVEADSPLAAAEKVSESFSLNGVNLGKYGDEDIVSAEQLDGFMVDQVGDDEFKNTMNFDFEDGKVVPI